MIKFHQKIFFESILFEDVNPNQIRQRNHNFKNINNIQNELPRFQIYQETELPCKYKNPLYKTHSYEILVDYEQGFDMNTGKKRHPRNTYRNLIHPSKPKKLRNTGNTGEKTKPQDIDSTRLQELSLKNNTYFGAIHYDIQIDMILDYTISRTFKEMSLSELETLHQLCELKRTHILQSLALAVLKIPYAG